MNRALVLVLCLVIGAGCSETKEGAPDKVGSAEQKKPSVTISGIRWDERKPDGTGSLFVQTTDGKEQLVEKGATKHWFSNDRMTLYYSYLVDASGGEGIKRYKIETGESDLIFVHDLEVMALIDAPTKSGRTALIVNMIDLDGGTPQAVVADPERGRVHIEKLAQFYALEGGMLTLGIYTEKQIASSAFGQWPKPDHTGTYDLDDLLAREASRDAPSK